MGRTASNRKEQISELSNINVDRLLALFEEM
jgi:hypothetical protein